MGNPEMIEKEETYLGALPGSWTKLTAASLREQGFHAIARKVTVEVLVPHDPANPNSGRFAAFRTQKEIGRAHV